MNWEIVVQEIVTKLMPKQDFKVTLLFGVGMSTNKTESLIRRETNSQQKPDVKKYLRKLNGDYKYLFLRNFNQGGKYFPNVLEEIFIKHFDLAKFVKLFGKKMKEFRIDVKYKLENDSSYNVYFWLVHSILKEVKVGIFNELYRQTYCDLEPEKFDYEFGRLSKKIYEKHIFYWTTQLNHDLFEGIEVDDLDSIPDNDDIHVGERKTYRIFLIDSIFDNVLDKYKFVFAVSAHQYKDALKIAERFSGKKSNKKIN